MTYDTVHYIEMKQSRTRCTGKKAPKSIAERTWQFYSSHFDVLSIQVQAFAYFTFLQQK